MDAFSGSATLQVDVAAAFEKKVATLRKLKTNIGKLHQESQISGTLLSMSEEMYSAICKDINDKMETLSEFARKLRTSIALGGLGLPPVQHITKCGEQGLLLRSSRFPMASQPRLGSSARSRMPQRVSN